MKYRIFGIGMTAVMLLAVAVISFYTPENPSRRVHQHLTARGPDEGCGCDGTEFCTHLPLVIIDTGGQTIPGEDTGLDDGYGEAIYTLAEDGRDVVDVHISIIDNQDRNNHPSDPAAVETLTEIRLRGHSSRHFEKAPYLLNFVDENGEGRDLEVMGMSAHSDWALYGPYLDKTLIRNYLWYNLSGEIMEWAPNVRYCELILDGEYRGLYLMMETITDGEDCRLDLRDDAYGSSVTGYLLREDRTTEEDLGGIRDPYTYMERSLTVRNDFAIRYPKRSSLTEELRERIELDYAAFEKALYSYDHDTEDYGYWNFIDEDNFVDYYLINEFSLNIDEGRYSTYLYKDMTGKYKLAVWDFNNACDNYMETETGHSEFLVYDGVWYFMLFKTERFVERVLERYEELRETYFSDEYLMNYIDETLAYLGPAIDRNFEVWGHTFADYRPLIPDERNPDSFEEAVEQLKHWLHERGEFMDESIHTLNQYAHPSRNKTYNH